MDLNDLMAKLEANAVKAHQPVAVEIDGVGTMYVRRRTVLEFEQMASLIEAGEAVNGHGKFGIALERLITDEKGDRIPEKHRERVAGLLASQPESVFHKLLAAADGTEKKAEAEGN